jgi:hypothetical protein
MPDQHSPQEREIERFYVHLVRGSEPAIDVQAHPLGVWVKYDDHAAALQDREAELGAEIDRLREKVALKMDDRDAAVLRAEGRQVEGRANRAEAALREAREIAQRLGAELGLKPPAPCSDHDWKPGDQRDFDRAEELIREGKLPEDRASTQGGDASAPSVRPERTSTRVTGGEPKSDGGLAPENFADPRWRCQRCLTEMIANWRACPKCGRKVFDPIPRPYKQQPEPSSSDQEGEAT